MASSNNIISSNEQDPAVIWRACQTITSVDPARFAKVDREGIEMQLPDCEDVIGEIIGLVGQIREDDIRLLPRDNRSQLSQQLHSVQDLFHYIEATPAKTLVNNDDVPRRAKETLYGLKRNLSWLLASTRFRLEGEHKLRGRQRRMDDAIRDLGEKVTEGEQLLEQMRGLSAEAGVSHHARVFGDAAMEHDQGKRRWLLATGGAAVLALAFAGWLVLDPPVGEGDFETIIPLITGRLVAFGILSYALVWCGRMYRAHAHNYIINTHRRNALRSFLAFVGGTEEPATKNAVLIQSTHSVFSHRPSGFGPQDSDAPPSSHLLELTRNITHGKGGE